MSSLDVTASRPRPELAAADALSSTGNTPPAQNSNSSSVAIVPQQTSVVLSSSANVHRSLVLLFIGAFLSMLDMSTDAVSITNFRRASQIGFANALAVMIGINMVVQLAMVFVQNKKKGPRTLLLEMFFAVTCLAPGVHAYRVAHGSERDALHIVDPRTMLIISKCVELVFEALPGLVLQLYAYFTLVQSSGFALVSISASAATIAFNVSSIYFDLDTASTSRESNPFFFGCFPEDATDRSLAFFFMFFFHLSHLFNKALGVALFWATFGGPALLVYLGCEMAAYFLVKILRRDLYTIFPLHGLLTNVAAAFVQRFVNKVMIDFTGNLSVRRPYQAGGLHYTMSLVWSQISAVIAVVLYLRYYDKGEGEDKRRDKISATTLYGIVGSVVFVWLVSFSAFVNKINQKYLHTFFGTMTGPQYTVYLFRNGVSDRMKMAIFLKNTSHWESIRDEVKTYTHENWDRLQKEKPAWFTGDFIASIPDEFVPRVEKNRRRSSAFKLALGLPDDAGNKNGNQSKVVPVEEDSGSSANGG